MSTRIRFTASQEQRATAITATTIVIGRRNASKTSFMCRSLSSGLEIAREVALRLSQRQHGSPDSKPCKRVVDFRVRQKTLRLGDFHDGSESRFIPSSRLLFGGARGLEHDRRVCGYPPRAGERRFRFLDLPFDFLPHLLVAGGLGPLVGPLDLLSRADRIALEQREGDAHAESPVLDV